MIIVKLFGGIGNQMFQYGAAASLADKNKTEIKLDVSVFENYNLRNFELNKLNISAAIASEAEIKKRKAENSLQRLKAKLTSYLNKKFYKEPFFHYDNRFPNLGNDVYMQGYFQSEKYFLSIADKIREEFSLKNLVSINASDFAEGLRNHQSVSIHIRKGDYKNPEMLKMHGVLPTTYYQQAIGYIESKFPDAKFYLFSDDPDNAEKEWANDSANIISGRITQNHFEDLYLMSQCRHNIIANSSFSWWGAWLNNNPDKIVIAPKNWFNNGPKDTYDLLPDSWIKI